MYKKKNLIIGTILILLSFIIFSNRISQDDNITLYESKIDLSVYKDNDIVMKVGNNKISKLDFDKTKVYYKLDSYEDTENIIVNNLIIGELAKEEGITTTKKEVGKYIEEIKYIIQNDSDVENQFNEFLSYIGQNEKNYWNDESIIERYELSLIIGKYTQIICNEILRENPKLEVYEATVKASEIIQDKVENEKDKVIIEYYY